MSFEAVFFDLDGTLVDVTRRFHQAYDEARSSLSLPSFPYEEFVRIYMEGKLSEDIPYGDRPEFWGVFLALFSDYEGPHIGEPMPGSIELL